MQGELIQGTFGGTNETKRVEVVFSVKSQYFNAKNLIFKKLFILVWIWNLYALN